MHNKFTAKFSEKIEERKEIISFFTSSEDEYAALDGRISLSDLFDSQRSAVEWLINWAAVQEKYILIVRLHPNQEHICSKDYDYWHSLSGKNVTLIPSHSKISSYDIIKKSTKAISFLSTIGIEATRMSIPSITIGNPVYKGMDAVYEPTTKDHLLQLLNKKIQPKNKENTLPYGYFNLYYGPQLQFMKVLGLSEFSQYSNILVNDPLSSYT